MTTPDPTLAARLAPCPFCGGNAWACPDPNHSTGWDIGCFNADCHIEPHVWQKDYDVAVEQWNIRSNQLITTAEADARVKAAVLAERAACAEILDDKAADHDADASRFRSGSDPHHNRSFLAKTAREHAASIRARGVTG